MLPKLCELYRLLRFGLGAFVLTLPDMNLLLEVAFASKLKLGITPKSLL